MPPYTNARLVAVIAATAASGGRDDWDTPGVEPTGAGASKWSGDQAAYYRQSVRRVAGAAGEDVVSVRVLYIDSHVARLTGVDTDDVIVFTDYAGAEHRARAAAVAVAELDGIPLNVQTARLELEEE